MKDVYASIWLEFTTNILWTTVALLVVIIVIDATIANNSSTVEVPLHTSNKTLEICYVPGNICLLSKQQCLIQWVY